MRGINLNSSNPFCTSNGEDTCKGTSRSNQPKNLTPHNLSEIHFLYSTFPFFAIFFMKVIKQNL